MCVCVCLSVCLCAGCVDHSSVGKEASVHYTGQVHDQAGSPSVSK